MPKITIEISEQTYEKVLELAKEDNLSPEIFLGYKVDEHIRALWDFEFKISNKDDPFLDF